MATDRKWHKRKVKNHKQKKTRKALRHSSKRK